MTLDQWLDRMNAEGYRFRCLTQAREPGQPKKQPPAIDVWTVYGPEGHLLTACTTRQIFDWQTGKPEGLFVYWIDERNSVDSDVEHLRAIDTRARQQVA